MQYTQDNYNNTHKTTTTIHTRKLQQYTQDNIKLATIHTRQIRMQHVQKVKTPQQDSAVYSFLLLFFLMSQPGNLSGNPFKYVINKTVHDTHCLWTDACVRRRTRSSNNVCNGAPQCYIIRTLSALYQINPDKCTHILLKHHFFLTLYDVLITYGWICRHLFDIVILMRGYEQD